MKPKKESLLEAVQGSRGIISRVSESLGVSWATARKWIDEDKDIKSALEDERDCLLDRAEENILKAVDEGDLQISKWVLATLGRFRGFNDKAKLKDRNHNPFDIF